MSDQYAVIGNPIGHTKSPLIHRLFAEATGQDLVYAAIEGRPGMNVTAPFKLDAFAFATDRSPRARLAGAANALKFDGERVLAENFDGVGLARDVVRNLGIGLRGRRVLLLGAGEGRCAGRRGADARTGARLWLRRSGRPALRPGVQRHVGQPARRAAPCAGHGLCARGVGL
jgi:hypothetical protein